MRDLPTLTTDVVNRATSLSARARAAREALPGTSAPSDSIAPAVVVNGTATLRIYDYIDPDGGYWGISANEFAEALQAAGDVADIVLRINSGGGSVWDGLAILNTLRSQDAKVTAYVDGVAASAASFIAVACDEVVMMPNSRLMIHDALGLCIGQAIDMRAYADFLDDTSDNIAEIYAGRAGGEVAEWRAAMSESGLNGKWYSAEAAVEAGLADSVGGKSDDGSPEDRTPTAAPSAEADAAVEAAKAAAHQAAMVARVMDRKAAEAALRYGLSR